MVRKIVQNCAKKGFKPINAQVKFVELFLDIDKKYTKEEMAEVIGVHRNTISNWFKNKDFVAWINSKKDELLNSSLMPRYKTAVRKAVAGDYSFSKMLFEMQKEYSPSLNVDLNDNRAASKLEAKLEAMVERLEDEKSKKPESD